MKYSSYILIAIVSLLTSCIDYDVDNHTTNQKTTYLQVGAVTYASNDNSYTLGEAEYVIKRARLYAFDGDVLDKMVYEDNIDANNLGSLLLSLEVTQTASKTLYLIINEPDNPSIHSRLALINNPTAFETLEYEMADYFNQSTQQAFNSNTTNFEKDKFCLPMFGKMENVNTASSSPITVQMTATRSLARVDVMVQKGTDVNPDVKIDSQTKISISNTRSRGYIAGVKTPPADAFLTNQTDAATGTATALNVPTKAASGNGNAVLAFTFYTPERDCTTSKLGFTLSNVDFGGKRMNFDVVIGNQENNPLSKIERNKVHQIFCTFTPKTTDVQINIKDWSDVTIIGDIPSSEFAISQSKVVMDWWNLGKTFDTSVSFASPDSVSFTAGDYYKKSSNIYTRLTVLPSWLTVTMPTLPAKTGTISLRYKPTNGDHSDVYIKLKSGKITKYIQVVYDNGYLTKEILQTGSYAWTTSTPTNGIHLAKSGPTLPSEETTGEFIETTFYGTNNNGLYGITTSEEHGTGLSNTLEFVDKRTILNAYIPYYCHNMGNGWYLPSINEFQTVISLRSYFGTSYRFYYYLTYTSSKYPNSDVNIYTTSSTNPASRWRTALSNKGGFSCIRNM